MLNRNGNLRIKNSIPLWVKFLGMGNRAWGMGKSYQCQVPNSPSRRAAICLQTPGDGVSCRLSIKIIGGILAAFNLALIFGGLVSCGVGKQQPLAPIEQQKPEQQLKQNDDDDDDDGDRNGRNERNNDNDRNDDKDDKDDKD
jgi:hypothetical protein